MKRYQQGGGLIESLIALIVLSVGILGLVGMQANLIQQNGESRVRMQAGFMASSLLGMAAANPQNVGCYIVNSAQSAGCTSADAQAQAVTWTNDVMNGLPNAASVPPQVAYDNASGQLVVTLRWRVPGDAAVHNFSAATQVSTDI
jgi:type IV pilus assembly protein PilV